MKIKMKYLILGLLTFLLFYNQTFAVGFLDEIYQPHLKVVGYNEVIEQIKQYTLEPVSIFSDDLLKRKWMSIMVSIGVILILAMLLKIGSSILLGSKNNLKKDLTYLILLFFIASIYTPFFSFISDSVSGKEVFYKEPSSGKEFARVYLPANTAISVQKSYVDSKGIRHSFEEIYKKRKDVFIDSTNRWSEDYLGIPGKVIQTQWVNKEGNPENRYSKILYSVNVSELFKGMKWPIQSLEREECHIPYNLIKTKGDGAPLSFSEALGKESEWENKNNGELKETLKVKTTGEIIATDVDYIVEKNCSLGLFFLSNEFTENNTFGLSSGNEKFNGSERDLKIVNKLTTGDEKLKGFLSSNISALSTISYKNNLIKDIWPSLSYPQRKRLVYTLEAIYQLNRMANYKDKKIKEDISVKNAMLACGRIITDNIQSANDYKVCLRADVYGDTTVYTQEATKNIGLSGKNKEVNKGYVFPVPQGQDWDGPTYYSIGRNLLSFLNVKNYKKIKDVQEEGFFSRLIGKLTPEDQKSVLIAQKQKDNLLDTEFSYYELQKFLPQLGSFEAYDLDGNGEIDLEEYSNDKLTKTPKYYSYFYSKIQNEPKDIQLSTRGFNYLKTPIYKMEKYQKSDIAKKFNKLGENEESIPISSNEISDYSKVSIPKYKIDGKNFFFIKGRKKKVRDINSRTLIDSDDGTYNLYYPYNPNTIEKSALGLWIKNNDKSQYFFAPDFNIYLYDKNGNKTKRLNEYSNMKREVSAYHITIGTSLLNWISNHYYIKTNNNSFYDCDSEKKFTDYLKGTNNCSLKTDIDGLSLEEYVKSKENNWFIETYYKIGNIQFAKREETTVAKVLKANLQKYIFIPNSDYTYSLTTKLYKYKNAKTNKYILFSMPTNYRKINTIGSKSGNLTKYGFKKNGTISLYKKDGEYGNLIDYYLYKANFDKLGQEFDGSKARILLNPQDNLPLKYSPSKEDYLPEYKRTDNVCLINKDYSTNYKQFFDYYPGKDKNFLNKCSLVGNHMRLTDIRLMNFVQQEALFNISAESESFTHISIPLLSNEYISDFVKDRRKQNYAGEAEDLGGLINSKKIGGIKIREGDIVVLKPGVVAGAYSYPFTMLVPKKIVPYLKYVKTDNPLEEKKASRTYRGGLYSTLTSFSDWFKGGFDFTQSSKMTNEEKYQLYSTEKYDSRPNSLKKIEGSVPDRYFSSYYGVAYYGEANSSNINNLMGMISTFLLSIISYILQYRVQILQLLYIIGPFLVFSLYFSALRKIFVIALTITIMMLLLPIIIITIVNFFS